MMTNTQKRLLSAVQIAVYLAVYLLFRGPRFIALTPLYTATAVTSTLLLAIFCASLRTSLYLCTSAFLLFAQCLGSMLGGYHLFWWYDLVLHFLSGVLLYVLGCELYRWLHRKSDAPTPLFVCLLFSLFFSLSCAALWEVFEFVNDWLLHLGTQGGLVDTMSDIIAGTVGGVLAALCHWLTRRNRQQPTTLS